MHTWYKQKYVYELLVMVTYTSIMANTQMFFVEMT